MWGLGGQGNVDAPEPWAGDRAFSRGVRVTKGQRPCQARLTGDLCSFPLTHLFCDEVMSGSRASSEKRVHLPRYKLQSRAGRLPLGPGERASGFP